MAAPEHLFVWEGDFGLPSVSTDCLTVLAYAQFAGAPLKVHKISNPWRSPSGSLPALRTNQNKTLTRPSDIIIHLRKQIYWSWVDSKNFVEVTRRWFADHMPFPLSLVLPGRMHRQQNERLRLLRGEDLLEPEENLEKEQLENPAAVRSQCLPPPIVSVFFQLFRDAAECMNLLSQRLGQHKFFFGESPCSLDAFVFGHLAPVLKIKFPNSKLQQHLQSLENLSGFCSNILQLYFSWTGTDPPSRSTPAASDDGDHVPHKRRKQLLSALVAVGAMLSYAVLTGLLSISLNQRGALEEPPDEEPEEPETHEREHER